MSRSAAILETAFEQRGTQWIWYGYAWSRGVVVTAHERELYFSNRGLFRKAIKGRSATEPRRRYWPNLKRMLRAILGRG